jgi:hypothetical protein
MPMVRSIPGVQICIFNSEEDVGYCADAHSLARNWALYIRVLKTSPRIDLRGCLEPEAGVIDVCPGPGCYASPTGVLGKNC